MNTKIIASLATIAVVGAAAVGGTVAYYTSQASMTGVTFSSANMDLKIDDDPDPDKKDWVKSFVVPSNYMSELGINKIKPGDSNHQILDLINIGDVNGTLNVKFEQTAWSSLGDNLVFSVYYDAENNGFSDDTVAIATGKLSDWLGNTYSLGNIEAGRIASVKIAWNVPTTAGNDIMGKSITLNTIFDLEQAHQ